MLSSETALEEYMATLERYIFEQASEGKLQPPIWQWEVNPKIIEWLAEQGISWEMFLELWLTEGENNE